MSAIVQAKHGTSTVVEACQTATTRPALFIMETIRSTAGGSPAERFKRRSDEPGERLSRTIQCENWSRSTTSQRPCNSASVRELPEARPFEDETKKPS